MGIHRAPEDSWTKEMAKWEMRPVLVNGTYVEPIPFEQGGRMGAPRQEYPKTLYRASDDFGGPRISDQKDVHSEDQERQETGRGWFVDQRKAIAAVLDQQREFAALAANRESNDKGMSERARAEATRADESTMAHLPAIPVTPIKRRRGRPARTAAAVGE